MRRFAKWVGRFVAAGLLWLAIQAGVVLMGGALVSAWTGLDSATDYVFTVGLGLVLFGVTGLAIERLRRGLPPPWGRPQVRGAAEVDTAGALAYRTDPTPQSTGIPIVQFPMQGRRDRTVELKPGALLQAITIVQPVKRTVRRHELPKTVRWQFRKLLVVKRFSPGAMLLDEHVSGVGVRAELFYEDDR